MEKTQNFKSTVFACYRGYITQGIVNNLSPLFFKTNSAFRIR